MNVQLLRVVLNTGHQCSEGPLQMRVLRRVEGGEGILEVGLGVLQGRATVGRGAGGGDAVVADVGIGIGVVEVGGLQDAGVAGGELHGVIGISCGTARRIVLVQAAGADGGHRRPTTTSSSSDIVVGIHQRVRRREPAGRAVRDGRGQAASGRGDGGGRLRVAVLHLDAGHRRRLR